MTHTGFQQECAPSNVFGPFRHTLFLGCSVRGFTCSMGWNEQASSISVDLVEDTCAPVAGHPKYYYPKPGTIEEWSDPDPGFSFPDIGSPVYFRIGAGSYGNNTDNDFEFAGVIQSWTQSNGSDGNPTYKVEISDPRFLLQNLEIIISDYAGPVEGVYNLINAYGWLESEGYTCYDAFVAGAKFGSPAGPPTVGPGGFGGAKNNDNGTPWSLLKLAVQRLLTGHSHFAYSPYGFGMFRGLTPVLGRTNMGELEHDVHAPTQVAAFGGNGYGAQYYVDLSEIPFAPTYYRIAGPSMNLLDIISQVCNDAGCDFYIELLVTSSLEKIIKVKCAQRRAQPVLGTVPPDGEIANFINDQNGVTTKNLGRELRNEPTQVFLYGGYVQTPYQQLYGYRGTIVQHWGYDTLGNLMGSQRVLIPNHKGEKAPQWEVNLDLRSLNQDLYHPIPDDFCIVDEQEMRFAIGDFDSWVNWALLGTSRSLGSGSGTPLGKHILTTHNAKATLGISTAVQNATQGGFDIKPYAGMVQHFAGKIQPKFALQDDGDKKNEDIRKIHAYLSSYADEHYGKKFLVQLPFVCYFDEPDSGQTLYSDMPSPDGGYPAPGTTQVLSLGWPSQATDFFSDDKGKLTCFGRFIGDLPKNSGSGVGSGNLTDELGESFIAGLGMDGLKSCWVKAEVEEKVVNYYGDAAALITFPGPVKYSGQEVGVNDKFAGTVEIWAQHGIPATTGAALIKFDPRLAKGDVSMSKAKKRVPPDQAMVPMKSNTTRYGPWGFNGPPGPVKFSQDDGLVPWEWGGPQGLISYTTMDAAALEKVTDGLTLMQVGERGGFTLPGFPTKRLGQEILRPTELYDTLTLVDSSTSPTYKQVAGPGPGNTTEPSIGDLGPNITSISTSIGDGGATTTFEFSTFTPSFGRMSKLNAERMKKAADTRGKLFRQMRDQKKLTSKIKSAQAKASKQLKDIKKGGDKGAGPGSKELEVGQSNPTIQRNATTTSPPPASSPVIMPPVQDHAGYSMPSAGSSTVREKAMSSVDEWANTSIMSKDGYLRPVSRFAHSSNLPKYMAKGTGCEAIPHQTAQVNPPLVGSVSTDYAEISTLYLDPFLDPSTPKHSDSGDIYDNHTDVVSLAHGSDVPATINMYELEEQGGTHPADVRFMALRGPLVVHGWGYDLEGKPVPNAADSEADARVGTFTEDNLTDKFMTKWLRKPHTWPLAPVDLRLDRRRGVWTIPNSFRIIHARATGGDIDAGSSNDNVEVVNMGTVYNDDGTVNTSGNIKVTNPEWSSSIESGGYFYAYYDTLDCTYYPIVPSGGSGGGGGSGCCTLVSDCNPCCDRWDDNDPLDERDCNTLGNLDVFDGCYGSSGMIKDFSATHLVFDSGIKLSTVSGAVGDEATKVYISAERYLSDRDSSGVLMPLTSTTEGAVHAPCGESVSGEAWFKSITFRQGLNVTEATGCRGRGATCGYEVGSNLTMWNQVECTGVEGNGMLGVGACTGMFCGYADDKQGEPSAGEYVERICVGPGIESRHLSITGDGGRNIEAHELRLALCVANIPCCSGEGDRPWNKDVDCTSAAERSICAGVAPNKPNVLVGGAGIEITGMDGEGGECYAVFNTTLKMLDEKPYDVVKYGRDHVPGMHDYCENEVSTGIFNVSTIKLGCGLQMSGEYKPCKDGEGAGQERCIATLSLNPCAAGADLKMTGVQVVRDVCCSGDGLRIRYTTLRFTECGLFTGTINQDVDCAGE